ncbi:TPA: HNH endonuclease [Streptococcus suis]
MLKLSPPCFSLKDILDELLSGLTKKKEIKDDQGKVIVSKKYVELFTVDVKERILDFEALYIEYAKLGTLHQLIQDDCKVSDEIDKEEMGFLYEQKLVKKFKDSYYLRLRTNENKNSGQCVYCERDLVSDLDHLLPKSEFPIFAVTPANLIPSCHACNKNKSKNLADIVNPYFEDTTAENWLKCIITEKNSILYPEFILDFSDTSYSSELQTKITNIYTMGQTSILSRISTWGVNKFTNKLQFWVDIKDISGVQRLIDLLTSEISSDITHSKNYYELSLYKGVIDYLSQGGRLYI